MFKFDFLKSRINSLLVLIILFGCAPNTHNKSNRKPNIKTNWIYLENIDEFNGDTVKSALCISENKLPFSPPTLDSIGKLCIKIQVKKQDTTIVFMTNYGKIFSKIISVKFDENEPIDFYGTYPSDGGMDYLILNSTTKFYNYLIKSKTIKIKALFFQQGSHIGVFNIETFNWLDTKS